MQPADAKTTRVASTSAIRVSSHSQPVSGPQHQPGARDRQRDDVGHGDAGQRGTPGHANRALVRTAVRREDLVVSPVRPLCCRFSTSSPGDTTDAGPGDDGGAVTVYLVIGVVGLVLVAVSLVLGDLFDGAFDALAGDVFSSAVIGGLRLGLRLRRRAIAGDRLAVPSSRCPSGSPPASSSAGSPGLADPAGPRRRQRRPSPPTTPWAAPDGSSAAIPADGFGAVRRDDRRPQRAAQREGRADPVEPGTEVHVTGILSPTAVAVAPVWTELT